MRMSVGVNARVMCSYESECESECVCVSTLCECDNECDNECEWMCVSARMSVSACV